MKKFLILLLTLCVGMTCLSGCGKAKSTSADSKIPVISLTLMGGPKTLNTPVQKALEKALHVKLNLIMLPGWDEKDVKTTLLMSDPKTMPDIVWWSGQDAEYQQWVDAGLLVNMLPLLKKYGKNILDYYSKDTLFYSYDNGKMYKLPADVSEACCRTTIIRQDWLTKLNLKVPTTVDDYINVLKAFAKNFPGTYAFSGSNNWSAFAPILYAYKAQPDNFALAANGTVENGSVMPQMKTALKVLQDMYKEKLIDPNMITQTEDTFATEIASGKVGSFYEFINNFDPGNPTFSGFAANNPNGKYIAIDPMKGPDGFSSDQPEDVGGWCNLSITKHAKDPAKCVQLLNALMSPAINKIAQYGVEGVNYKMVKGIYTPITPPKDNPANGIGLLQDVLARKDAVNISNSPAVNALFKARAITAEPLRKLRVTLKNQTTPAWTQYGADLNELRDKTFYAIIIGQKPISAFDTYVKQWYAQGGTQVTAEANRLYKTQQTDAANFDKTYNTEIAPYK